MPMKNLFSFALMAFVLSGAASLAQAQSYRMDYRNRDVIRGETLHLKRDLEAAYGNIDFRNSDLIAVTLVARARSFDATATLIVGRDADDARRIGGGRDQWDRGGGRGGWDRGGRRGGGWNDFDRVTLFPRATSQDHGPWMIEIRGDVVVSEVVVEIRPIFRPEPPRRDDRWEDRRRDEPPRRFEPTPDPGYPVYPGRPDFGRRTQYVEIECASADYKTAYCDAGGTIASARLVTQHSNGAGQCRQDSSWKIEGRGIRVDYGCRARFGVEIYR
jgi:hypothetical protein